MPTTFDAIYLGRSPIDIDQTKGNTLSENVRALVGTTFGSSSGPLFDNVQTLFPVGSPGTSYDSNNDPDLISKVAPQPTELLLSRANCLRLLKSDQSLKASGRMRLQYCLDGNRFLSHL